MKLPKLIKRCRIDHPRRFRLDRVDPGDTGGLDLDKHAAKAVLVDDVERLAELQKRLYADGRWAVLVVLQGMDAAGKDGVTAHVMSGINPQGCAVHAFKAPSEEELAHHFLWRSAIRLPEHGRIGIFNRSYYEDVLVVRVHPDLLAGRKLSPSPALWKERFHSIRAFERDLVANRVAVLKFFLHISAEEQRRRLLGRLDEPEKRWKFSLHDIEERKLWDKYMAAYEEMLRATSRPDAPWYVIPADSKPFARLMVAAIMIDALDKLDLAYPKIEGVALKELEKVRAALMAERPPNRPNGEVRDQKASV